MKSAKEPHAAREPRVGHPWPTCKNPWFTNYSLSRHVDTINMESEDNLFVLILSQTWSQSKRNSFCDMDPFVYTKKLVLFMVRFCRFCESDNQTMDHLTNTNDSV